MRISDWSSDVCSSDLVSRGCRVTSSTKPDLGAPSALATAKLWVSASPRRNQKTTIASAPPIRKGMRQPQASSSASVSMAWSASRTQMARSEEHTSELQSLMRISYAVFCLKKKRTKETSRKQKYTTKTLIDKHSLIITTK